MQRHRVTVCSLPDYEDLVAEVYVDDTYIGLIGWALAETDDGGAVFPLWPAKEYAQICAANEWKGYEPRSIALSEFTEVLLPKLKLDGVLPGVFPTPTNKGITPSVEELKSALDAEM
jgi:hypothetical protein